MKIIISRKGFDSSAGEGFSPILEDGKMISFPIPEPNQKAEKKTYTKLKNINFGDVNLGDLAKEVYAKHFSKIEYHLGQLMQSCLREVFKEKSPGHV
jgi:hypothetical protein